VFNVKSNILTYTDKWYSKKIFQNIFGQ